MNYKPLSTCSKVTFQSDRSLRQHYLSFYFVSYYIPSSNNVCILPVILPINHEKNIVINRNFLHFCYMFFNVLDTTGIIH